MIITEEGSCLGALLNKYDYQTMFNDDQKIQYTSSYNFMRRGGQSGSTL